MFNNFAAEGYVPEQYRELFEYFREHYKNSNKGIKGRGKVRSVGFQNSPRSSPCTPPMFSQPHSVQPAALSPRSAFGTVRASEDPTRASQNMTTSHDHMIDQGHRPPPQSMHTTFEHQQGGLPPAGNLLYGNEHSRPMPGSDRLY